MDFINKTAIDFTVLPAPANNCSGCWFSGKKVNRVPMCWAAKSNNLVKQVFAKTKGSCTGVIAVLADEVNIKKNSIKTNNNDSITISRFNDSSGNTQGKRHY